MILLDAPPTRLIEPANDRAALRWKARRSRFVVPDTVIDPKLLEVAVLAGDREAKAFVVENHYSGTFPSAQYRFGLYMGPFLVGVAVFSVPQNDASLALFPGSPRESIELGRFVLLDRVPFNAETFFLARCFEHLRREGLVGVISFSDPHPRTNIAGETIFLGHYGTIYAAFNGCYVGRSRAEMIRLLPDGTTFPNRAAAKVRAGPSEQGFDYAVRRLVAAGARPLAANDTPALWLAEELPRLVRQVRHPGKFKYAWLLQKHARWTEVFSRIRRAQSHVGKLREGRFVPRLLGLPYPKRAAA